MKRMERAHFGQCEKENCEGCALRDEKRKQLKEVLSELAEHKKLLTVEADGSQLQTLSVCVCVIDFFLCLLVHF